MSAMAAGGGWEVSNRGRVAAVAVAVVMAVMEGGPE